MLQGSSLESFGGGLLQAVQDGLGELLIPLREQWRDL